MIRSRLRAKCRCEMFLDEGFSFYHTLRTGYTFDVRDQLIGESPFSLHENLKEANDAFDSCFGDIYC
jgi:hypothetical protein